MKEDMNSTYGSPTPCESSEPGPWLVTHVQAQLDEMAGACNELERAGRSIKFIVPIPNPDQHAYERATMAIAIFSLPKSHQS
jgi:hypothetical protein